MWDLTFRVVIMTSLLSCSTTSSNKECLDVCVCKWKGGKQTVECVNASLSTEIPAFDKDTQVLDLSSNFFPLIRRDIFQELSMPNLQKVYLSSCSIRVIEDHAFR